MIYVLHHRMVVHIIASSLLYSGKRIGFLYPGRYTENGTAIVGMCVKINFTEKYSHDHNQIGHNVVGQN